MNLLCRTSATDRCCGPPRIRGADVTLDDGTRRRATSRNEGVHQSQDSSHTVWPGVRCRGASGGGLVTRRSGSAPGKRRPGRNQTDERYHRRHRPRLCGGAATGRPVPRGHRARFDVLGPCPLRLGGVGVQDTGREDGQRSDRSDSGSEPALHVDRRGSRGQKTVTTSAVMPIVMSPSTTGFDNHTTARANPGTDHSTLRTSATV